MSRSPSFTEPVTRAIGLVSCIRFKQRTKVDLPQPEGPIKAVARFAGIVRLISCRVCVRPYQAFRFCTSIPAPTYAPNVIVRYCAADLSRFDAPRLRFPQGKVNCYPRLLSKRGT